MNYIREIRIAGLSLCLMGQAMVAQSQTAPQAPKEAPASAVGGGASAKVFETIPARQRYYGRQR